jgi:hypothetical protein
MQKSIPIDQIALKFSSDVVDHIKTWMRLSSAEDMEFHKYRMKFLSTIESSHNTSERLVSLMVRVSTSVKFEIMEAISDKAMGEYTAKYIFSKLLYAFNEEYRKALDHEMDRVKSENNILLERASGYKNKLDHH